MITEHFVNHQELLDQVIKQLVRDIADQDFSAIEELLKHVPESDLINYLPQERNYYD
jgi:hypothetical protein